MASISSTTEKKKKNEITVPPRRGQIKAQIFESLVKTFVSITSRAGAGARSGASSAAGEASASASTTPPASSYDSDA